MNGQRLLIGMLAALCGLAGTSQAQSLHIHSFDKNGQMQWTNSLNRGVYQVQWRESALQGNWSTNGLPNLSLTNAVVSADVLLPGSQGYYRVTWTNPEQATYAVSGAVRYLTEPVTNLTVRLHQNTSTLDSVTTDLSGAYRFAGLASGDYWIEALGNTQYNGTVSGFSISNADVVLGLSVTQPMTGLVPTNGAVLATNLPSFAWNSVQGTDHYHLRVMNNATRTLVLSTNVATLSFQSPVPLSWDVSYMWILSAFDAASNEIAESWASFTAVKADPTPGFAVTGSVVYLTQALPGLPVQLYAANFSSLLMTTTSDVSGAYAFTGLANGNYLVGTPGNTQYNGNVYYAANVTGAHQRVDVSCTLLLRILSPANNSTVRPNPPTFAWETIPGTDHYQFELRDNLFNGVEVVDLTQTNYQTVATLSNTVRYSWQVTALNGIGQELARSDFNSFTYRTETNTITLAGTIRCGTNELAGQVVKLMTPDWSTVLSTVTSSVSGAYAFSDISAGDYVVQWTGDSTYSGMGWFYSLSSNTNVDAYLWRYMILISPASNEVVQTASPTFLWGSVPGADYYKFYLTDNSLAQTLDTTTVSVTSYQTTVSLPNNSTNKWRVVAYSNADSTNALARTPFPGPSFTVQLP